ncbi:hemolysin III family protein [Parahaliea sp. F7430]|uniref:Hemolysin III family protein n=1 Tax=Sediminihaliea albiluteola TaxID=2758564 RepID=A0A7W2TXZ5_9GAMM|nr:hemolysin III family protein [Sediminihaliea albiluteola]MBA6414008.1 hemolysin III family protein [Sediminihaliea albiluteola]
MYEGERLNSISHLIGAVLALVGLGALLTIGLQSGDPWVLASFTVFGITMVLLYTMSTLYHSFSPPGLKKLFQIFDHVSIYLLIAGSYTPFMLVTLRDGNGWLILSIVWAMALVGILSEIFLSGRAVKAFQIAAYLAMGWACVYDLESLRQALPSAGFDWLVYGGLAYTTGVVFYLLDKIAKLSYAHGAWHLFVVAGSLCHFIAVIGYVH